MSAALLPLIDWSVVERYDRPTPRYTSYPPATALQPGPGAVDLAEALAEGNRFRRPLSLYVHLPFCRKACYFCGCNRITTGLGDRVVEPYLDALEQELDRVRPHVAAGRAVAQLQLGGGSPSYLSLPQMARLREMLERRFHFAAEAECGIEINPEGVSSDYIRGVRQLGFNRISFGVQDIDPLVQAAINRVQPLAQLQATMAAIREADFASCNLDLVYGLPYQTRESFAETLRAVIALDPDRIALFSFAYLPDQLPLQRRFPAESLPDGRTKLALLRLAIEQLTAAGYEFIGMDHFAKPTDELAQAQRCGTLHRNFQGYTTTRADDLLGFGVSAISMLPDLYLQNHKGLKDYYRAIAAGELPIERGLRFGDDDTRIRRAVVMALMCRFRLDPAELEQRFGIQFERYFRAEQPALRQLALDGLIREEGRMLRVTPLGRLLLRNVAHVFDAHSGCTAGRFSRAI